MGYYSQQQSQTTQTKFLYYEKMLVESKKSILNQKVYDLLATIEINKIDNWKDVKGKSIWTNVNFKDHTEINNNSHLCFSFATRSFSDLTSSN